MRCSSREQAGKKYLSHLISLQDSAGSQAAREPKYSLPGPEISRKGREWPWGQWIKGHMVESVWSHSRFIGQRRPLRSSDLVDRSKLLGETFMWLPFRQRD